MTEKEKIHSGNIYFPNGDEILEEQLAYLDLMDAYNRTSRLQFDKRRELLQQLFAEVGEGTYVESPYFGNWGGHHVHLGRNVYINAGLKLVDDTHIYIGDYSMLGPNVVAVGNPCRVLRPIGEHDREYYWRDRKIDPALFDGEWESGF